jgi:NodT family efflux transporter outer membrane factor (OMF) lipoprotein
MKKIIILFAITLTSCADKIATRNLHITKSVPKSWQYPITQSSNFTGKWWEAFQDTVLDRVFIEFNENSPELKTIVSRLEMARQVYKINIAPRLPSASLSLSGSSRQQNLAAFGLSEDFFGSGQDQGQNSGVSNDITSFTSNNFGLNLSMQWEIDIWKKIFNQTKAAEKDYESIEHDIAYLSFSMQVQLAKLFYETIAAYNQYGLAIETLESIKDLADMVSARYEKGLRSSLDVRLTQSSVSSSKALLENRRQVYTSMVRRLQAMLGEYPDGSYFLSSDLPSALPDVPPRIPADILKRRPDIRSALAKAQAASYRTAESISSFFPGVALTSSIGTSSTELKDILNEDYQIWSQGLNIVVPVFQGGRLIANKKMRQEAQNIAKQELIQTIIRAFSEVEQTLFSEESNNILLESYSDASEQAGAAYKLSRERYDSGLVGLIAVLDSQQRWFQARSQVLFAKKTKIDTRLNLILALGGDLK